MKQTKLTTLFSLAIVCAGMGMAFATRAAYTNFLDSLQAEVTARVDANTNEVAAQNKALAAANNRDATILSWLPMRAAMISRTAIARASCCTAPWSGASRIETISAEVRSAMGISDRR